MAKKSGRKHHLPTLHKTVSHEVAYIILAILFILAVVLTRKVTGVAGY